MKITSRSLHDVLCDLPDIEQMADARHDDVFIAVLGFEERALSIPRRLDAAGYRSRTALYLQYRNAFMDNSVNLGGLMAALSSIASVPPIGIHDTEAAQRIRGHVLPLANATKRELDVTFDMSAASTSLVIEVMKALIDIPVNIRLCYTEAATYFPTEEEYKADPAQWLSNSALRTEVGVNSVCISPEYPGQHYDPLPHWLVMVPGFNPARTKAMLAKVDESLVTSTADAVTWLLGVPHLVENQWRCQALAEINEIDPSSFRFEVSTFDYKDMMRILERVRDDKWRTHNMTIALLGSKLQSVGAALFCYLHPEVRVMVSSPVQYMSAHYSNGASAFWQIRFGSASALRGKLLSIGELQISGN